jgi:hypothetical protein
MPYHYRVVSQDQEELALERSLNDAAVHGYRLVATVGRHMILEREVVGEVAGDAAVEIFRGECPVCGTRYVLPVLQTELRRARVNPDARIVKRISPECGHEIVLSLYGDPHADDKPRRVRPPR